MATSTEPGDGSGSLTGSVAGSTFSVASVLAFVSGPSSCSAVDGGSATCGPVVAGLTLANRGDYKCVNIDNAQSSNTVLELAKLDTLEFNLANPDGGSLAAGTYTLGPAPPEPDVTALWAGFETTTSTCSPGLDITATGGTVTLTHVDATSMTGTFSVSFGAQGSFSGTFDALDCAPPPPTPAPPTGSPSTAYGPCH